MNHALSSPPFLIAEDDPLDVWLLKNTLSVIGVDNPVLTFRDGAELVQYLEQIDSAPVVRSAPPPCLLLLDLKMPRVDGFEVITWLRARSRFATLPIIVISGDASSGDLARAVALGAQDFLRKPVDPATLHCAIAEHCDAAIVGTIGGL